MKILRFLFVIVASFTLPPVVRAQVPQIISFQGKIAAGNTNYDGAGQFKFALVDGGGTTFWSNDGTGSAGAEPTDAVTVNVDHGLFSVLLGDSTLTNMQPIASAVFTNPDVRLRIWFGGNTTNFQVLSPDQRVAAVGYAMVAANVPDGSVTSNKLAAGAVSSSNIAKGAITSLQLASNSVSIPAILNGAVTTAKLGLQSVTTPILADGAVTAAKLASQSVTAGALASGAVTSGTLGVGAVTASAIPNGVITQAKLDFQLGYLNAKNPPFGAKGDGVSDDTLAIQSALNTVAAGGGGIVYLPTGNYFVSSHLTVPAQTTLAGVWRAPQAYSQNLGTTLLAVEGAGATSNVPFITLQGNNSTLDGVTIFYPNQVQNDPPIKYPWAIAGGGGENVTVQNVSLVNPYLGIDLATHNSARHLIRAVYGQPLAVGIAVDQCYDIGRIMDIHFWPFWTQNTNILNFQQNNAVTFDLMRTDWEVVEDVFSWGYKIGARFRASANGAMNGQMSNVNFDNVDIGLQMIATQPYAIHISNLNLANAGGGTNHIGIQGVPGSDCELNVNGASFWGLLKQPVLWNNPGLLSLSNGRVLSWDASLPAVEIVSGRAIIQGNFFADAVGNAIRVRSTTDRVMVLGNMLAGNTVSLAGPHTLSANNQP